MADEQVVSEEQEQTNGIPEGFMEWYDPQNKKKVMLPKKIGDQDTSVIMGHLTSGIRKSLQKEVGEKYSKQMEELRQLASSKDMTLQELQVQLQKYEDEKLTNEQRIQKELERERNKYTQETQKFQKEAEEWQSRFKQTTIDNSIFSALPPSVYNPTHTMLKEVLRLCLV
jgi:nitrogen fixation/metabolism regulation signal transduction histidine kinase